MFTQQKMDREPKGSLGGGEQPHLDHAEYRWSTQRVLRLRRAILTRGLIIPFGLIVGPCP